jgi:hypothetical protein
VDNWGSDRRRPTGKPEEQAGVQSGCDRSWQGEVSIHGELGLRVHLIQRVTG